MASARNEAPKGAEGAEGVKCEEGVSLSPPGEGCGEVAMLPPRFCFDF